MIRLLYDRFTPRPVIGFALFVFTVISFVGCTPQRTEMRIIVASKEGFLVGGVQSEKSPTPEPFYLDPAPRHPGEGDRVHVWVGQLNRQGDSIEPPHNLVDRTRVASCQLERGIGGLGPF